MISFAHTATVYWNQRLIWAVKQLMEAVWIIHAGLGVSLQCPVAAQHTHIHPTVIVTYAHAPNLKSCSFKMRHLFSMYTVMSVI